VKMATIEPTPEDYEAYEAARRDMDRPAREIWLEIAARQHARTRIAREHAERNRARLERRAQRLRRLFPFLR
jgi:hypothetical protein